MERFKFVFFFFKFEQTSVLIRIIITQLLRYRMNRARWKFEEQVQTERDICASRWVKDWRASVDAAAAAAFSRGRDTQRSATEQRWPFRVSYGRDIPVARAPNVTSMRFQRGWQPTLFQSGRETEETFTKTSTFWFVIHTHTHTLTTLHLPLNKQRCYALSVMTVRLLIQDLYLFKHRVWICRFLAEAKALRKKRRLLLERRSRARHDKPADAVLRCCSVTGVMLSSCQTRCRYSRVCACAAL